MSVRLRQWQDPKSGVKREAWMIDVKFEHADGSVTRVRKASPVNTRRGAEQYERDVRAQLLAGTYGKKEVKVVPTLKEFEERFLVYAANNNKPSTLEAKKSVLANHILPALGRRRLDEIDFETIEGFKATMRKKLSAARHQKDAPSKWAVKKRYGGEVPRLSDKTINNSLSVLRKMLALAVEWGALPHMPRVKLFKVDKPAFDFLSFEEAQRLVDAADPEWRTLILLALRSGLRQGELIGLQWSDVDLVQGRVNVRRTIWKGKVGSPKGGRGRSVDVPPSVVAALKVHRHLKGPWVFCDAEGNHLSKGALKAPLDRALRRSGISRDEGRIGWHDLRHTYGSHLAMRGVPLKAIQELMGHATVEMTMRYAHLSPETRRAAVLVLDQPAPAGAQQGHMGG